MEERKEVKVVNLTPHTISISKVGGKLLSLPSQGVARVTVTQTQAGSVMVDGVEVPVYRNTYGEVTGLPDPAPDTAYIVSGIVLASLGNTRPDVYAPDTGATAIRDEGGRIVAVTRLLRG